MTSVAFENVAADLDQRIDGPPVPVGPPLDSQRKTDQFAVKVKGRWDEAGRTMADARRSYWMNLAFYLGQQWVWWSAQRNLLMPYPRQIAPLGVGRVRLVCNRYGPNVLNVWNRLLRSELVFEVPPSDSADNIVEGAKKGEKILEAARRDQGWEALRGDEILAAILGGTSAVVVEWDQYAGKPLSFDHGGDQVNIGTGDVRLRSANVNEFAIEPNVRNQRDARWGILGAAMPCASAMEHYGLKWMPRPDASPGATPLYEAMQEGSGRARSRSMCLVLCYYERPSRQNPKGVHGTVINGVTVGEGAKPGPWPFEFDELNFHLFRQKRVDGRVIGATYADDAISIQAAYNHARSVLQEHLKLAGNARMVAPFGSITEEDLTGPAGSILWYSPDGAGTVPNYMAPPNLPRWVTQEAENLAEELDNVMHVHDISRGVGFSRASGQALSFLAEQDDSALGHMVFEQKQGWERIAGQVLTLYGNRATETREAYRDVAPGITEAISWTGKELQGQYRVTVPLDAVTPRNAAARLANAKDLWDRKIITDPRRYARMVGLPPDEFGQLLDPDAEKANRENMRMVLGFAEVPDTFDDDAVHIAEHNDRLRKTDSYRYATADIRKIVDDHILFHEKNAAQAFAKQSAIAAQDPAAASVPQADAPPGSDVPAGEQEAQGKMAAMAAMGITGQGGGQGGGAQLPAGPTPAMATGAPG